MAFYGREGRRRDGGVTYACRLGDGWRTAGGGWEAPLDPYTTQHVQQYLSIRTFHVNTHTHTHKQVNRLDMHTHHSKQRERIEIEDREMKRERARTYASY